MSKKQVQLFRRYGDVLLLDATYKTSQYKLAQVHGVVIDCHGKARLIFCALVAREVTPSYEWILSNITRVTGMAARVLLVDQDKSVAAAMEGTWQSSTTRLLCKFHLFNNIKKALEVTVTGTEEADLRKDLQFADYSASERGFRKRTEAIKLRYAHHEKLSAHLQRLMEEEDHWAGYIRKEHQSIYFSTAQVELAHAQIKKRLDQSRSLASAVKACLDLEESQHQSELLDVFHTENSCRLDSLHASLRVGINRIIQDVAINMGDCVHNWLYEQVNLKASKKVTPLSRVDVLGLLAVEESAQLDILPSSEENLPSGQEFCCTDIPTVIVEQANDPSSDLIYFRVDDDCGLKTHVEFLGASSNILSFSKAAGKFWCSCIHSGLRGYVCCHFLACFSMSSDVWYNSCMWASRWRAREEMTYGPVICHNRAQEVYELRHDAAERLRSNLAALEGGVQVQEPEVQVDKDGGISLEEAQQALSVLEDAFHQGRQLFDGGHRSQLSEQARRVSECLQGLDAPVGSQQSLLSLDAPHKARTRGKKPSAQYWASRPERAAASSGSMATRSKKKASKVHE